MVSDIARPANDADSHRGNVPQEFGLGRQEPSSQHMRFNVFACRDRVFIPGILAG